MSKMSSENPHMKKFWNWDHFGFSLITLRACETLWKVSPKDFHSASVLIILVSISSLSKNKLDLSLDALTTELYTAFRMYI